MHLKVIQLLSIVLILFVSGCSKDESNNLIATPLVSTTSPANNAINIPRNSAIKISFTTAMDPASINTSTVIVNQGPAMVPGMVTYSGSSATFTPTDNMLALTSYVVTVTTGAKTLAGRAFASNNVLGFTTGGSITPRATIDLGTAIDYVILAKTAINNFATSAITGDLGLSPAVTSYITGLAMTDASGYATSSQVTGKLYAADMANLTPANLAATIGDMFTAYNDAASRTMPDFVELGIGSMGDKIITPGLYKWTSDVIIPTNIILSGNVNDVWIFQIDGDLIASSAVNIILTGDAQANNIFWQVAGKATLGATSHFEGIILSRSGITLQTGASLNGQAFSQTAVTLDSNLIAKR